MQQDLRTRRVICSLTEADLDRYKAKLVAEGWIIEDVKPYQESPREVIYYRIVAVEAEKKADEPASYPPADTVAASRFRWLGAPLRLRR